MKKSLIAVALLLSSLTNAAASDNTTAAKDNYPATAWEHYAADEYAGGTGTKDDPYLIATPEQLMKLAVEIENKAMADDNWDDDSGLGYSVGKYFKQTADLVFNANVLKLVSSDSYGDPSIVADEGLRTFDGIGYNAGEYDYQRFRGVYDGGGHSISGLYCKGGKSATGLFNFAQGAVIKNLVIKDSYLSANANVGLVVGYADNTTIINCQTSGMIYCGGSYHAGIAGTITNGSKLLNCVTDAQTWAKNNCGGIVGTARFASTVANCYYGGWLGGVKSNLGKFKFYGAVCPELGLSEAVTETPDPENPETMITTCENPSKAINVYWTDTCTVRYVRDKDNPRNWAKAPAFNDAENCKFGVFENCKAVALADMASTVAALNAQAEKTDGASKWKVGDNGLPTLEFDNTVTGIAQVVKDNENSKCDVYSVQGILIKESMTKKDALHGLRRGVYIVNGKKIVVR